MLLVLLRYQYSDVCPLLQAEHELRVAQTEFDRQAEVTRLLLEGISSTHVSDLWAEGGSSTGPEQNQPAV